MIRPSRSFLVALSALAVLGVVALALILTPGVGASRFGPPRPPQPSANSEPDVEVVDVIGYLPPRDDADGIPLADDRLADKKPAFDPALVDRRPIQGWSLNASDAVLRLDVPIIKPDRDPELLVLHASHAQAVDRASGIVLPSVNLIDGKAKQFDDGLYAALDRAYYLGRGEVMKSHLRLLRRVHDKVAKVSPAADYLAAGLSLGGEPVEVSTRARSLVDGFLGNQVLSKPIAFYTWDKPLLDCFRVLRFFAQPLSEPIAEGIAQVLRDDAALRDDYRKAYTFHAKLTNPLVGRTPLDFVAGPPPGPLGLVTLFPPSSARESELFAKLFPRGLPADANLMRELIVAIRSGKVDLKPRADGGWYDHQVYALETLLLPEKGAESGKLLLTRLYKKRMLEAFQALMTKRRETHARQFTISAAAPPVEELTSVEPRLRVEPGLTYYLRTARSYAFLADFLEATLGESTLKSLHGRRESGEREMDLHAELIFMRELFYGMYLIGAEDIGLKPAFLDGEKVDPAAAERIAEGWLARRGLDPDLAADTRVAVPIHYEPTTGAVRLWATIGVRLAVLQVNYMTPPKVHPVDASADWKPVPAHKLRTIDYLIPVDEFAEVEIQGGRVLDRAELRAICDQAKTKAKIIEALKGVK